MSLSQFIQMSHGINPTFLNEVNVVAMDDQQREIAREIVQPKRCFDNCFRLAMHLDVTYVLGVYHHLIPIEHAWLKVGDVYIDPTLEMVTDELKGTYLSLVEVRASELIDFVVEVQDITNADAAYPPMFEHIKHHPEFRGRFVSNRERSAFFDPKIVNI